jgi:predicted Zn-dependent protease
MVSAQSSTAMPMEYFGHWQKSELKVRVYAVNDINPSKIQIVQNTAIMEGQDDNIGWNDVSKIKFRLADKDEKEDISILLLSSIQGRLDGKTKNQVVDGTTTKTTIEIYHANSYHDFELESIVKHELGHALGLQHIFCKCVMNPRTYETHIAEGDIEELYRWIEA